MKLSCNNFYLNLYTVSYFCVLIVFLLHRESLKLMLVDEPPPRGGSITLLRCWLESCDEISGKSSTGGGDPLD
jgi:hypothetical protein